MSSDESDPEAFEVERIVDYKKENVLLSNKGIEYYLIKWKGYTSDDNTWEGTDNLHCPEIMEKFWKDRRAQKESGPTPKKQKTGFLPSIPKANESHLVKRHAEVDLYGKSTFISEKELSMKILALDSWEDEIDKVLTISPVATGHNMAYVLWKDDTKSQHELKVANKKFPQKVLLID